MAFMCFAGAEGWACSSQWLIMVVIFFIAAIARRQLVDLAGVNFSLIGATALGEIVFVIFLFIFDGVKFTILIGLVGVFVGGFIGSIWDQSDGDGGFDE